MKINTRRIAGLLVVALAAIVALVLVPTPAVAQEAAATAAAAQPAHPTVGGDILAAIRDHVPGWLTTALTIFGTVSLAAQGFIGWAHKRAAETTSPDDDAWIAKAEASAWFRVIDRIIYFGGYLGSWSGGKKL